MDRLKQQVSIARRRLLVEQFFRAAALAWLATLLVACAAIGAGKIWALPVDPTTWLAGWLGGALLLGAAIAGLWTWRRRTSSLAAALEIDGRFGLKERVSSSLALSEAERGAAAGEALLSDALQKIDRLNVSDQFQLRLGRRALGPVLGLVAALGVALFFESKSPESKAEAKTQTPSAEKQLQEATKALPKQFAERRQEAQEKGLKDADELFKKLEEATRDLSKKEGVDHQQALVKLNDLTKDLEKRRQQLASDEKLKEQLQRLKAPERGPADKLAKAMKQGDFQKAAEELDKLKKKLADDQGMKAEDRQQLAKQLDQMREALDKAAQSQAAAKEALAKQIDQQRQAGNTGEADKLQQQLDKLEAQAPVMNACQNCAKALGAAAQSLNKGQKQMTQQQLDQLSKQLSDLQKSMTEGEMLDEAMKQIADAKNAMNCKGCKGAGCEQCQGKSGMPGGSKAGRGTAEHAGLEKKTDTKLYDSSVRQQIGKDAGGVVVGEADGPNLKGLAREEIKAAFENARQEDADPLVGQRLPRDYRDRAGKYFDKYRQDH